MAKHIEIFNYLTYHEEELDIPYIVKEELLTLVKDEYKHEVEELKDGDLVDMAGYRGTGLFYLHGNVFIKTPGEYGYFLPSMAWKHGIDHYKDCHCGAEFILIPTDCDIRFKNNSSTKEIRTPFDWALHLNEKAEDGDDYLVIDGIKYDNAITGYY